MSPLQNFCIDLWSQKNKGGGGGAVRKKSKGRWIGRCHC